MTQRHRDDPQALPAARPILKAIVRAYDTGTHTADIQIVGSHPIAISSVRVATNIPPADVVTGRQCTVLFLDPSNQDDAVIIAIQGALPSVGEILIATSTANLTLTTSAQSIVGNGDSSKVRLLLPTPGDWLIEATFDLERTSSNPGTMIGELYVDDSGTAEDGAALFKQNVTTERATVPQRWKVTTTAADTPVELKAKSDISASAVCHQPHTRLTATGVKRSTGGGGGGVTDHGALTGRDQEDHSAYGPLSQANAWAALQTFGGGIQLAAGQTIKDSGGAGRIVLATSNPNIQLWGHVGIFTGNLGVGTVPSTSKAIDVLLSASLSSADLIKGTLSVTTPFGFGTYTGINVGGSLSLGVGHISAALSGLSFDAGVVGGTGGAGVSAVASIKTRLQHTNFTGTITGEWGIILLSPQIAGGTPVWTTTYGIEVQDYGNHAGMVDMYGVKIADSSANTGFSRLLEVGPATPYLRVVGRAPPDAALATEGDSNLYLAWMENGTVNLRQVRWRQQSSLGATDKVLIAA